MQKNHVFKVQGRIGRGSGLLLVRVVETCESYLEGDVRVEHRRPKK